MYDSVLPVSINTRVLIDFRDLGLKTVVVVVISRVVLSRCFVAEVTIALA